MEMRLPFSQGTAGTAQVEKPLPGFHEMARAVPAAFKIGPADRGAYGKKTDLQDLLSSFYKIASTYRSY